MNATSEHEAPLTLAQESALVKAQLIFRGRAEAEALLGEAVREAFEAGLPLNRLARELGVSRSLLRRLAR